VARGEDELLGACWVARGRLWSAYLRREIELGPYEALTYETYTTPSARGLGVGPELRAWVVNRLREDGFRRLLATVSPDNRSAVRLVEKLGYRRVGTIGYLGAGGRRRDFVRLRPGALPPGAHT
jgi:ribosomal protein S18 acetylase RimI-like enzyme